MTEAQWQYFRVITVEASDGALRSWSGCSGLETREEAAVDVP